MKIPSLFLSEKGKVTPNVTPGCEWVLQGEGWPSVKWDGIPLKSHDGAVFMRREVKGAVPRGAIHISGDFFWVPLTGGLRGTTLERKATDVIAILGTPAPGMYEVVGPGIKGNPHGIQSLQMMPIMGTPGQLGTEWDPRTFEAIKDYLERHPNYEGVVWWNHVTGAAVKATRREFGLEWGQSGGDSASGGTSSPSTIRSGRKRTVKRKTTAGTKRGSKSRSKSPSIRPSAPRGGKGTRISTKRVLGSVPEEGDEGR